MAKQRRASGYDLVNVESVGSGDVTAGAMTDGSKRQRDGDFEVVEPAAPAGCRQLPILPEKFQPLFPDVLHADINGFLRNDFPPGVRRSLNGAGRCVDLAAATLRRGPTATSIWRTVMAAHARDTSNGRRHTLASVRLDRNVISWSLSPAMTR